jgi:hypothetical protein
MHRHKMLWFGQFPQTVKVNLRFDVRLLGFHRGGLLIRTASGLHAPGHVETLARTCRILIMVRRLDTE